MESVTGIAHLVGIGSGRPSLLSGEARHAIRAAECAVYQESLPPAILALLPDEAVRHCLVSRGASATEEEHFLLARLVRSGQRVVRLFSGDPLHCGGISEVAIYLASQAIPFEVVPGIDALGILAAECGIPLLHPGVANSLLVVRGPLWREPAPAIVEEPAAPQAQPAERRPGVSVQRRHKEPGLVDEPQLRPGMRMKLSPEGMWISSTGGDAAPPPRLEEDADERPGARVEWPSLCRAADSLVFLNCGHQFDLIGTGLLGGGRPPSEPVAILSPETRGHWRCRVVSVRELSRIKPEAPASVVVVGDAVALREVILPHRQKPLEGIAIGIAGPENGSVAEALAFNGARVVFYNILRAHPVDGIGEELALLADDLRAATHLLATSPESARHLFSGLREAGLDARVIPEFCRLAVAGSASAEVFSAQGFRVDTLPQQPSVRDILDAWGEDLSTARIMLFCDSPGEPIIVSQLRPYGARVSEIPVCAFEPNNRELARLGDDLQAHSLDYIAFSTPAAVRVFAAHWSPDAFRRIADSAPAISLSERATEQMLHSSITPAIEAEEPAALIKALRTRRA